MDITTLAAIGEFVGGLAVLVTLVYLALQTRISVRMHEQSVNELRSQMFSQNADGWSNFFLQTATDERLASIVKKLQGGHALEESEIASAEQFLTALCMRLENVDYQQASLGLAGLDELLKKQIGLYANSPDFQRWWSRESQVGFSDPFVGAVNSILGDPKQSV